MLSFATQSWTRERYPMTDDEHGNEDRPDLDAEPDTLAVAGCSIQPGAPSEVLGGRDATRIVWTVYQPSGFDVLSSDFGRYEGVLYRVSGHPQRWSSPTGAVSNDVILLERVEG